MSWRTCLCFSGLNIDDCLYKPAIMKLKIEAPWHEVKEKLKENDHTLTDEDLVYEKGKEDELLERLGHKLKRTKEEVRMLIESISGNSGKAT